jgi:hypothetical protein
MPKEYEIPIEELVKIFPKDKVSFQLNGKIELSFHDLDVSKTIFNALEISEYTTNVSMARNSDGQKVCADISIVLDAKGLLEFLSEKPRSTKKELIDQKKKALEKK